LDAGEVSDAPPMKSDLHSHTGKILHLGLRKVVENHSMPARKDFIDHVGADQPRAIRD
jgi:hypothetical protein